ncbi:MAG: CoA transferase [Dehalococcoidia bacterium]|nr:CoA transferase [Dehalococcoidia bacterium]
MPGPLEGMRVLDLSWVLSGPYATMVLADLGAEVIKVERPFYGDRARGTAPFMDGHSSYFMSVNRGKKSVTIDLTQPKGKDLILRLVERVDVLVENFTAGTMADLGLDYPVLQQRNPRLIYAAISGFGQTGPYAERPALDIVVQAMSGMMSINGEPGRPPARLGISLGDLGASLFAVVGILAALEERHRSGKGQMLDLSMLDCQVALAEGPFMRYLATGEVPQPLGSRHPVFTPFQAFPTQDGYIVVAIIGGTNDQWALFCFALDRIDLAEDVRFVDGWTRTQHHAVLEPMISEAMKRKTTAQWLEELTQLGIPCGPVNTIAAAAADPQVQERRMLVQVPHKDLGQVTLVNSPLRLSRTPGQAQGIEPDLGEHTAQVLGKILGLGEEEVQQLRDVGVI